MDKTIVVAWDFSKHCEFALNYAIYFANHLKTNIKLLHIAKNSKNLVETEQKLLTKINDLQKIFNGKSDYEIKKGNIYSGIGKTASENFANLVVMGSPGISGLQKYLGSRALKVIIGNEIPFLVVHKPLKNQLKRVLFPISEAKETLQKLVYAKILNDNFSDLTFEICFLKINLLHPNIKTVCDFFEKHKIKYEKKVLEGKNLQSAAAEYVTTESNCNFVVTMVKKNLGLNDLAFGADDEKLIFNGAKIPVMCINPKLD